MKLNDIYKNLNENLDLKGKKKALEVDFLNNSNNIDSLRGELEDIQIKEKKELKLENKNKKELDNLKMKNKKGKISNINLKNIIKKQGKILYKISSHISKIHTKIKNSFPKNKVLRILSYLVLIFSFIFLDKIIIENLMISGINNLYRTTVSSDINKVETELSKAKTKFNIANILFLPFKLIPEQNIINVNNTIDSLNKTTKLGLDMVEVYKKTDKFIKSKKVGEIYFSNLVSNLKPFSKDLERDLKGISESLNNIKLNKNNSNYNKLEKTQIVLKKTLDKIAYINNNYNDLLTILGKGERKKYFILFQNNDEIRPTGGFIGSAGIIEIFEGRIQKFEKKDIYAYEWDVNKNYTEQIQAPSGVNLLSKRLGLRDANAFIDFETSAKSINYFMKKGGYDIDGVIFINQKVVLDVLKEIGPIEFGKYNTTITEENFSEVISLLVEAKVSKQATLNTPKQVLFDFSNLLKQKIFNKQGSSKKYFEIGKILLENIVSRDITIINFNKKENKFLEEMKLTGSFDYKKFVDFNYPFFISVGGNKSDRYIKRKYNKYVTIEKNTGNSCLLNTSLKIDIENSFKDKDKKRVLGLMEKFRIKSNTDLINIAGAGDNKSYTKVIIPKNTILNIKELNKFGYKTIEHDNYKTIEKLITTKSSSKSYFEINYKIKDIDCENHNFKIYKQPGIYNYDLKLNYNNSYNNKKEDIKVNGLNKDFNYNL